MLKKSTGRLVQFKEEVLSDAIYTAIDAAEPSLKINVPAFEAVTDAQGNLQRKSQFIAGHELGLGIFADQKNQVAAGFIVDAFMANWDLVKAGKNLWLGTDGQIYRMDNGGSLRYRALGELKNGIDGYDFNNAASDIYTLRGIKDPKNPALPISQDKDVMTFLQRNFQMAADTLENPSELGLANPLPPLQKVYRHSQQAQGKVYETQSPEILYSSYLSTENVESIRRILAQNPAFDLWKEIKNPNFLVRPDRQDRQNDSREMIYPLEIIVKTPKLLEFFIENQLDNITSYALATQSTATRELGRAIIQLFKKLVEQDKKIDEAIKAAIAGIPVNNISFSSYALLDMLFKKGRWFKETIAAVFGEGLYLPTLHDVFSYLVKYDEGRKEIAFNNQTLYYIDWIKGILTTQTYSISERKMALDILKILAEEGKVAEAKKCIRKHYRRTSNVITRRAN